MAVYQGIIRGSSTDGAEGLVSDVRYTAQTVTAKGVPYHGLADVYPIGGRHWMPVDDPSGPYVMPAQYGDPCLILTGPGKAGLIVFTEYITAQVCSP